MSALSASTCSCSGEGDLFGLGGDGGVGAGTLLFLTFRVDFFPLAFRKIGASFSSSLAGGEDRAEDSESDMLCRCGCLMSTCEAARLESAQGKRVTQRRPAFPRLSISLVHGRAETTQRD